MASRHSTIWSLSLALICAACGTAPNGATCQASVACTSQLCYANVCLDPAADDDGDGLDNRTEHRIGSHPQRSDSDEDGKRDDVEVGPDPLHPIDSDGDGLPDVVESQSRDTDLDCLPDERDADNTTPNTDPAVLARDACSHDGVCVGQADKISASCQIGVGTLTCVYTQVPGWSAVETCDGIDNDCDGATDEGHSYQGTAVGQACYGEGACGEGVVQCKLGRAACSTNPGGSGAQASVEICNGLDDDCDGETDEGFGLPDAPVGVPCLGTGECGIGKVVCGDDGVPLCSTDPGGPHSDAAPETCNGLDDDCDGATDEHITLDGVSVGGDCMGRGACGPGIIVCGAKGEAICSSNPESPGSQAKAETCNGLDDNCNGQTDEGFTWTGAALGAPCEGVGACGKGTVVCSAAGKATCSTQPDAPGVGAKVETCDGLDDDCDGATDEGFVWQGKTLGAPCDGLGICGVGTVECNAVGAVTCSSNGDGSQSKSVAEACNGLDDDCDGVTDEGVPPSAGPACAAIGLCVDATGKPACVSGAWSCAFDGVSGYQGPHETSCDGLDNDCDGLTDEGLPHTWAKTAARLVVGAPSPRLNHTAAVAASAKELCIAGGLAARLNSDQPGSPGELWCLNPEKSRWRLLAEGPELARVGGALVAVPAGWSGPATGPAWWLFGGVSTTGGTLSAVSIDATTGVITPLLLPGTTAGGLAFVRGKAPWQIRTGPTSGAVVTRYVTDGGNWTASAIAPQVAAAQVTSACQDTNGGLWLYGLDAAPTGDEGKNKAIVGALWQLAPGATAWLKRPAPPASAGWSALLGAQLVCEPAPGQIWLHGGTIGAPGGGMQVLGVRRFDVKQGTWSQPSLDVTPKVTGGYVARVGGAAVMAWGSDAQGPSANIWSVSKGTWVPLHAGPLPAVGSRLLETPAGLLRIGGAGLLHQLEPFGGRPVWLLHQTGWKRIALPPSAALKAGRVWPLAAPAGPDQVLIWGGITDLPAPATASVFTDGLGATPGAVRLNTATGAWSAVPASLAAALPTVLTGAAMCHGTVSATPMAWVFGRTAPGVTPRLWQLNAATAVTTQLWDGSGVGPTAATGAALLWDTKNDRLLHIASNGGLVVWVWPLSGKPGWSKLVTDVAVASGAVVVLGDLTIDDPLVAILPVDSGAKPALRRLGLGAKPALAPVALAPPAWRVPAQSVWTAAGAVVLPGPRADGLPVPGLLVWPRACVP